MRKATKPKPKQEQAAYDKLLAWAEKHRADLSECIDYGTAELMKSPAAIMGGIV